MTDDPNIRALEGKLRDASYENDKLKRTIEELEGKMGVVGLCLCPNCGHGIEYHFKGDPTSLIIKLPGYDNVVLEANDD